MKKRILITGGSGFIGHHLVEHVLKNTDWDIVVLDKLSYAGDVSKITETASFDKDRISVYWHDLRAPIMDTLAERIGPPNYIVNMASESHVDRSIEEPTPFVMNNVALTLNMLDYARQVLPEKFIQISTDEVFGPAPMGYDFKEWDSHIPSNPYAASKSAQESIAISYWRTYKVPVAILNGMNAFGERQHPEKFIPLVIRRLRNGVPVPVHAEFVDGEWKAGSRHWLHARNFSDAILFALREVDFATYPAQDRPTKFNVVGDEYSNLDIVEKVASILGTFAACEFVDFHTQRPGHDRRYALDGSKLAVAGWRPPFGFEESLRKTVLWTVDKVTTR